MKSLFPLITNLLFHPNRNVRTFITLIYTLAGLVVNFFVLQVFCMPVWWTAVPLVLFILSLLLFPYAGKYLKPILSICMGAGAIISIYSIVFLADPWGYFSGYIIYTLGVLFVGVGLLPFLFVYYLYHIYRYFKEYSLSVRAMMMVGALIPVIAIVIYLIPFKSEFEKFNKACGAVEKGSAPRYSMPMEYPELLNSDMYTEQFLGIGIKYHTKLEYIFDGWRPPLHNPLLNIGLWLYSDTYYPKQFLNRPKYYKQLFPDKSYRVNCPCSYTHDGMTYIKGQYWYWGGSVCEKSTIFQRVRWHF